MSEIPSWFWMIIIAGLSGVFGMILFYTAMLIRESLFTVREARLILKESRDLIASAKEAFHKLNGMFSKIQMTVETVSDSIIQPFVLISSLVGKIKSKISGLKSSVGVGEDEVPEYYSDDESLVDDSEI